MVRFVHDQIFIVREDSILSMGIAQEQRVVDYHQMSGFCPAAGLMEEAALFPEEHAGFTRTPVGVGADLGPQRLLRGASQEELRSVSCHGRWQPYQDLGQHPRLVDRQISPTAKGVEAIATQVVASALQQGGLEIVGEHSLEIGDVLPEELVLKIYSVGGYDHSLIVVDGESDRGEKIRERFARARASFNQQLTRLVEGFAYCPEHLLLLGTALVPWKSLADQAFQG